MTTLIPVDGSRSSVDALNYAAQADPEGDVLLLHVSPSGKMGDLERGRFLLESSKQACKLVSKGVKVHVRLEVGNPSEKLRQAAEGCDRVVMGAHGVNALPQLDEAGSDVAADSSLIGRPVVLVLPTGEAAAAL